MHGKFLIHEECDTDSCVGFEMMTCNAPDGGHPTAELPVRLRVQHKRPAFHTLS